MNYGELKRRIRNLGFGDDTDMADFEDGLVADAINLAIAEIGKTFPVLDKYEFTIETPADREQQLGLRYIDMLEEDDGFIGFSKSPVIFKTEAGRNPATGEMQYVDAYKVFSDYEIEMGRTIIVDEAKHRGKFRVYYKRRHLQFTDDTPDDTEIELPVKVQHLIPLLTAHYVWLEDNMVIADKYYAEYQQMYQELLAEEEKPRMRVNTSWRGL